MGKYVEYLKRVPLFSGLSPEQLEEIDSIVLVRSYKKGRMIFAEGESGEAVFILKSGLVKLTRQAEDGREHILHLVHPGDIFAEIVLFDGGDYPATAEVLEDAKVAVIRNRDIEGLITGHSDVALAMLKIMAKRLRQAQEKVMNLALNDTLRRLVQVLLHMAEEHGEDTGAGVRISMRLTNQELANLIGTTRETINRILNSLKRDGSLELDKQGIVLLDKDKLQKLL